MVGRTWAETTGRACLCAAPRAGGAPSRKNQRPKNCSQSLGVSGKADTQLLATGMAVLVVKKPEIIYIRSINSISYR